MQGSSFLQFLNSSAIWHSNTFKDNESVKSPVSQFKGTRGIGETRIKEVEGSYDLWSLLYTREDGRRCRNIMETLPLIWITKSKMWPCSLSSSSDQVSAINRLLQTKSQSIMISLVAITHCNQRRQRPYQQRWCLRQQQRRWHRRRWWRWRRRRWNWYHILIVLWLNSLHILIIGSYGIYTESSMRHARRSDSCYW